MPITLRKMASNSASVSFQYGADMVTVCYYPGRVTEKIMAQVQSLGSLSEDEAFDGFHAFNETLANLIKSWDVFEDDEQTVMFPIETDRFAELPFEFRAQLVLEIVGDIRPKVSTPQTKTQN